MSAIQGLLQPGAQTAALSPMNGRGDTFGVSLSQTLLNETPGPAARSLSRGDRVFVLPDPDGTGAGELRIFFSPAAVDAADAWDVWNERGDRRTVVYMNGRQDTLGVCLPCDYVRALGGRYDVTLAPHGRDSVTVYLPTVDE